LAEHDRLRSLEWKVLLILTKINLKIIEINNPELSMKNERSCYNDLTTKFLAVPSNKEADPLSLDEDSPWHEFFKDEELKKIIRDDVERAFPDIEFLKEPISQSILINVLFIWCKIHPDVRFSNFNLVIDKECMSW
jgi:hypothetical protein